MKIVLIIMLLFMITFVSCSHGNAKRHPALDAPGIYDTSNLITLKSYNEVPSFIQHALSSKIIDTNAIADPGEDWDAGCVSLGLPRIKFGWAKLWNDRFQMCYYTGGIAMTTHFVDFDLDGQKIKNVVVNN
jgi:hypothetical protein